MTRANVRAAILAGAALLAVTALLWVGRDQLDKTHITLAYLLVVLGASAAGGRILGLSIAALAFLGFNFLFLPPHFTLIISDPLDWLVLVAFLVTSAVAAQLLHRANRTTELANRRADEVDRLATLGAEALSAPDASAALHAMALVIRDALGADSCALFKLDAGGALQPAAAVSAKLRRNSEGNVARDAEHIEAQNSEPHDDAPPTHDVADATSQLTFLPWLAGRAETAVELMDGTTRLDPELREPVQVRVLYRTLRVRTQSVGVLRVSAVHGLWLTSDRARLLDALSYYAALGVERVRLVATVERAEAERQAEVLRSALLTAVSHDLRTPLTTIKGLAHEIAEGELSTSRGLSIEQEADRLDHMVADLLDLSRIQAGAVRPVVQVNTADELIGAAMQQTRITLAGHTVVVSVTDDVLAGRFDFSQTLRILVNLLENAGKYSPVGSTIEISAARENDLLCITVADEGPGVAASEVERIFEPFYRPAQAAADVRGTGLGLSIARGLAESQGGRVTYRARAAGGSLFTLTLPAVSMPQLE